MRLLIITFVDQQVYHNPWLALFSSIPFHKRKGGQVRFSNDQTIELERKFSLQKYLSPTERKKVAKKLQLSERQVNCLVKLTYIMNVPICNLLYKVMKLILAKIEQNLYNIQVFNIFQYSTNNLLLMC